MNRFFISEEKSSAGKYRYSFNGMEKDDEVKGKGNSYDFGARMYDNRLGRWLSLDAKKGLFPSISPYSFANNSPVQFIDIDGNILGAVNESSLFDIYNALLTVFSANSNLQALFTVNTDNLSFNKIDEDEFLQVLKDIDDPYIRALAKGFYQAVNTSQEYIYMVANDNAVLSKEEGFNDLPIYPRSKSKYQVLMEQFLFADNVPIKKWGASYVNPNDILDESIIMVISCESMSEGYWRIKEPSWEEVNGSYIIKYKIKKDFNRQLLTLVLSNTITSDPHFIAGGEEGVPQNRGAYDDSNNLIKSADLTFQVVNLIQEVTKAPKVKGKTSIPRELKEKKSRAPHLHPQTKSKNPRFL